MSRPTMDSAHDQEQREPAVLHIFGPNANKTVLFDRTPFTIGRNLNNDLPVADPNVSRSQAAITREGDAYYLEDKNSTFGTFINGARISRQRLAPEDRITFGGTESVQMVFSPGSLTCATCEIVPDHRPNSRRMSPNSNAYRYACRLPAS
ncbi:MAG: FHA domain-containing protein [Candidatus Korobacteraceae bacterium]